MRPGGGGAGGAGTQGGESAWLVALRSDAPERALLCAALDAAAPPLLADGEDAAVIALARTGC